MKSFCLALGVVLFAGQAAFGVELEDLRDTRARWAALLALQDLDVNYDGAALSALTPMSGQALEGVRAAWKTETTNFNFFRFLGRGGSYRGYVFEVIRDGLHDFCNAEVVADGDLGSPEFSTVKVRVYGCVNHILTRRNGSPLVEATVVYSKSDVQSKLLRCEQAYRDTNELCDAGAPRAWSL